MVLPLDPPLQPRAGVTLKVLAVCRISTAHQDPRSLDDQEALHRRYLAEHFDGPTAWEIVRSQGSGEHLDRAELDQIETLLESRRVDLLIAEDLGRICRRTRAYDLCELAEDAGTRVLALNDAVDTGRDHWQMGAFFSVVRHEMYNKDTAARIRRSLRNRFAQGGVIQFIVYGYIKPAGARTDAELAKDPAAAPIYDAWFRRLEEGASYSEVADWLNAQGIAPGPFARQPRWDGRMVQRVTFNPILKGLRVRNQKLSKRVNKTGRHRAVPAPPEERLERAVPHLAFIDPARYDRVLTRLRTRNARYRRRGADGRDDRKDVPRKRTRWPGQHLTCGVCGRLYYYGGHGRKEFLMCSGARDYCCWNALTVDGPRAAERIAEAIRAQIEALPDFDAAFHEQLRVELEALRAAQADRLGALAHREARNRREIQNITDSLRLAGPSPALIADLHRLEQERDQLLLERQELEGLPRQVIPMPSRAQIRHRARAAFADLAHTAAEFGRLMQRLVPRLEVRPYRLVDGGGIVLRAHLTLDLVPLIPEARALEGRGTTLQHELVVDLFDPPQRARFRESVLVRKAQGRTELAIAQALGLTVTAVQRAVALDRLMQAQGLTDPYVPVLEPPGDLKRLRRHRHPRYHFEPLTRDQDGSEPQDREGLGPAAA